LPSALRCTCGLGAEMRGYTCSHLNALTSSTTALFLESYFQNLSLPLTIYQLPFTVYHLPVTVYHLPSGTSLLLFAHSPVSGVNACSCSVVFAVLGSKTSGNWPCAWVHMRSRRVRHSCPHTLWQLLN
jgi:hypothetical protein